MPGDNFNWYGDDPSIIQRPSLGVAIYPNGSGEIIVLEQADWCRNSEDQFVSISLKNAVAAARAILSAVDIDLDALLAEHVPTGRRHAADVPLTPLKDATAAERQRRRRDRQRDSHGASTVTSVTVTPTQRTSGGDLLNGVTNVTER